MGGVGGELVKAEKTTMIGAVVEYLQAMNVVAAKVFKYPRTGGIACMTSSQCIHRLVAACRVGASVGMG